MPSNCIHHLSSIDFPHFAQIHVNHFTNYNKLGGNDGHQTISKLVQFLKILVNSFKITGPIFWNLIWLITSMPSANKPFFFVAQVTKRVAEANQSCYWNTRGKLFWLCLYYLSQWWSNLTKTKRQLIYVMKYLSNWLASFQSLTSLQPQMPMF